MRLRDRDVGRIVAAPFQRRHWAALGRMFSVYTEPGEAIRRYLTNGGAYPWSPGIRTPLGIMRPDLQTYHDLLTVNEVFCRHDYGDGSGVRTVVDIGANIGLASLFFLTRNPEVRVWCFEPDPANTLRLRQTLEPFEDRYTLVQAAVTPDRVSSVRFSMGGRYGHIAADGDGVEIPAVSVDDAIGMVGGPVDLVKIDTEGTEQSLVAALPDTVRSVVYEDNHGKTRWARRA